MKAVLILFIILIISIYIMDILFNEDEDKDDHNNKE